mmetsp:Transcript_423/g.1085  ORF Transcript_423/g.1085 Transcript_423/m.1085 type:complete len:953 (+) Transcript_423:294-3152(+)
MANRNKAVLVRFGVVLPAFLWASCALFSAWILHPPPPPSDPIVRAAGEAFRSRMVLDGDDNPNPPVLHLTYTGALQHDAKTVFWNHFADRFGSNPSTPYMYSTLPLFGSVLPLLSPMWNLRDPKDAVVLIARVPPKCDYFGLTTFALWVADGRPGIPFSSLGDSLNNYHDTTPVSSSSGGSEAPSSGLFAHVVTANSKTASLLTDALAESGISRSAIHVVQIPVAGNAAASALNFSLPLGSSFWYPKGGAMFEVVMRLFRFENQTLGEEYLSSFPPVFYVEGHHDGSESGQPKLSTPRYKDRSHPDTVREDECFGEAFAQYGKDLVKTVGRALRRDLTALHPIVFQPLKIRGLECLRDHTNCLGDSPDAAYFGPNIDHDGEEIPLLQLEEHQVHLVTLVDHKAANTSVYSSVAILAPPNRKQDTLSRSRMAIRGTRLGVTSLDFAESRGQRANRPGVNKNGDNDDSADAHRNRHFVSWAFSRNPVFCDRLLAGSAAAAATEDGNENTVVVDGCTVVEASDVPLGGYMTYCERVYLNPVTGLGPDWNAILSARLYTLDLEYSPFAPSSLVAKYHHHHHHHLQNLPQKSSPPSFWFSRIKFPKPIQFPVYDNDERFRLLHIVKTGGESLQNYLDTVTSPRYTFETCRAAALQYVGNDHGSSQACFAGASIVSAALCALNCECCARDIRSPGGFHGTLIRSPRAHALSLFAHGHAAHHASWRRIAADVPLYLAEVLLRGTESACGSYCTGSSPDWKEALRQRLAGSDPPSEVETSRSLRVLPLENTQSHALTCSKSKGSLGHHVRISAVDLLEPNLEDALASLRVMEWVGVTDLMEPSLCLLHYQANGTLPEACDCNAPQRWAASYRPLGYWKEHRYQSRSLGSLSPEILAQLDDHTRIDRAVFVEAVRLLLGRLKHLEQVTGANVLECIDWDKFQRATHYIRELWDGGGVLCCE